MADLGEIYTPKELRALSPKERAALKKRAIKLVRTSPDIRKIIKKHPTIRKKLKAKLRSLYHQFASN